MWGGVDVQGLGETFPGFDNVSLRVINCVSQQMSRRVGHEYDGMDRRFGKDMNGQTGRISRVVEGTWWREPGNTEGGESYQD